MLQFEAEILSNEPIAESWRLLVLGWDERAGEPEPGQFLTLRVSSFSDPLLRRPFAFAGYGRAFAGYGRAFAGDRHAPAGDDPGRAFAGARPDGQGARPEGQREASVVYQVRGGATRILAELAPGSRIDAIGPLGRGFPLPEPGETPIIAGGGIGLGPLLYLASALAGGSRAGSPAPLAALGFRSASQLPRIELPAGAAICTDDGSAGFRGTPVDWISRNAPAGAVRLYGCGPAPMLAALAELAAARGWRASLSAEQWMACGVGACMGCALRKADGSGYLRACADGPVFDSGEIDWRSGS